MRENEAPHEEMTTVLIDLAERRARSGARYEEPVAWRAEDATKVEIFVA